MSQDHSYPSLVDPYVFTDPNGRAAHCALRLVQGSLNRIVVVATELRSNPGMSITNAVETLATQVVRRFELDVMNLVWIEHYTYPISGNPLVLRTYDRVEFRSRLPGGDPAFIGPQWRAMTDVDWADLNVEPLVDALRFDPGHLVQTPAARDLLDPMDVLDALSRHFRGDWGELCEHDRLVNERSLSTEGRLFSVYRDRMGTKFYAITESDRSATTVLLPDDY